MKNKKKLLLILGVFGLPFEIYSQEQPSKGFFDQVCEDYKDMKSTFPPSLDCNTYQHGDWVLVFEDEFNGSELNTEKWYTCEDGWNRRHGSELQYYNDPNITTNSGYLYLTAKREPGYYNITDFDSADNSFDTSVFFEYTSGWTQTKMQFRYGLFEIRCRIPEGDGFWPAFWFFGNNQEIDVFEFCGEKPKKCNQNIHHWHGEESDQCPSSDEADDSYSEKFHTFSLEWDEFRLIYRIDGRITRVVYHFWTLLGQPIDECYLFHPHTIYRETKLFPSEPMPIILNLAISSGSYCNPPNSNTPFPSTFEIDYIRVYKKNNPNYDLAITESNNIESYNIGRNISLESNNGNLIIDSNQHLFLYATNEIVFGPEIEIKEGATLEASIINPSRISPQHDTLSFPENELSQEEREYSSENDSIFFTITPNPSQGNFSILLKENHPSYNRLYISDLSGHIFHYITVGNQKEFPVNLYLPKGLYLVWAENHKTRHSLQLIIQ